LKLVHVISSGIEHFARHPIVTSTDIDITSVSGIHGPPIAEWVVMNWLVSSRLYDVTSSWQREHKWQRNKDVIKMMQDHVGKRVGILGYGSIGRQGNSVFSRVCRSLRKAPFYFSFLFFSLPENFLGLETLGYTYRTNS
jgi:phosphoglycerate dehydrogenase-like enzyme